MKRFFTLVLGALAMVAVALISAFITMRLAIHGREAVVPALTGLGVDDASKAASHAGLNLTLENRFYSAEVPAGRILAQDPAPGSRVRRDWPVRITESLGPQSVNIPNLAGESERAATVSIRRLSLDLGVVAHLAVPGDGDIVLTQTPPANSAGVDGPRVSLLVSDPEGDAQAQAYVMPSLLGLSYAAASERADAAGLRLVAVRSAPALDAATAASAQSGAGQAGVAAGASSPSPAASAKIPAQDDSTAGNVASVLAHPSGAVVAQFPQPGRRVSEGDVVHVTLAHPAATALAPAQ
jgi:beta-lactam-binding protein with PASTA domain